MEEYNYESIIINPYSDEAKSYIGRKIYYGNNPAECLSRANYNNGYFLATLKEINTNSSCPFIFETENSYNSDSKGMCIILKKEEEPKYVPFKNSGEFISEFEDNTPIMHIYGLWLYEKISDYDEKIPRLVTEMWGDGVVIGSDNHTTTWKELLERFVFENNEPCGKLQEKNNG